MGGISKSAADAEISYDLDSVTEMAHSTDLSRLPAASATPTSSGSSPA